MPSIDQLGIRIVGGWVRFCSAVKAAVSTSINEVRLSGFCSLLTFPMAWRTVVLVLPLIKWEDLRQTPGAAVLQSGWISGD
jgi:hypothetical protein